MMLFQEEAQKKIDAKKRCKQAEDESPGLSFAQMTKADVMKKDLCFKCGKHGHSVRVNNPQQSYSSGTDTF